MGQPDTSERELRHLEREMERIRQAVDYYVSRYGRGGGYFSPSGEWGSAPTQSDVMRLRRAIAVYAKKLATVNAESLVNNLPGETLIEQLVPALRDLIEREWLSRAHPDIKDEMRSAAEAVLVETLRDLAARANQTPSSLMPAKFGSEVDPGPAIVDASASNASTEKGKAPSEPAELQNEVAQGTAIPADRQRLQGDRASQRQAFVFRSEKFRSKSRYELAKLLDLDPHTVNAYLDGKTAKPRKVREALAQMLKVKIEQVP